MYNALQVSGAMLAVGKPKVDNRAPGTKKQWNLTVVKKQESEPTVECEVNIYEVHTFLEHVQAQKILLVYLRISCKYDFYFGMKVEVDRFKKELVSGLCEDQGEAVRGR